MRKNKPKNKKINPTLISIIIKKPERKKHSNANINKSQNSIRPC